MKIRSAALCLIPLALLAAGCRKSSGKEPPVARASVSLSHSKVPLGSPVEITYEFKVAQAARINGDYRVFVHFKDADDELMWTDDHYPVKPTSEWKPGETIKYSRLVCVPVYPYVGEAWVDVGLHNRAGKRLALDGTDRGGYEYRLTRFQVAPQTDNIYVTFKDGWHLAEMAPDNASNEWHWTKKDATLSFKNPKTDVTFYLDVDATAKLLPNPQTVTVSVSNQVVDTFALGSTSTVRRIPISAAQLGSDEKVELRLSVDQTFVPAVLTAGTQHDSRELGIRVFHAFVEAKAAH